MTPFKKLITGKGNPVGQSGQVMQENSAEEVAEIEGTTPAKQRKVAAKSTRGRGKGRGRGKRTK